MKVGCLFQAFCQPPLSLSTQVKMKVAIGHHLIMEIFSCQKH